ncbi:hypothetical protein ACJJTC_005177 [Scirpophaga incertulas]
MPKRKIQDKISYYENKLKYLQEKSKNKRNKNKRKRLIMYSSSSDSENNDDGTQNDSATVDASSKPAKDCIGEQEETIQPNLEATIDLDPELLSALGDAVVELPTYGEPVHQFLVQRLEPILKKGLLAEAKNKLLKEFNVPENCKLLKAPTLNPEISAALSDVTRNRDKNIQTKQEQLGLGITAISRAITSLLQSDDKALAVKILTDGCRILADLHYTETDVRKKLITPILEKPILSMIRDQDRDDTLFGNELPEKIKASRAIEKQGQLIKKSISLQRTPSASYSAVLSTSKQRFQGNASGSPRYTSANRRGRGGPTRAPQAPPTYRRAAQTQAASRSTSSHNATQRTHSRR